MPVKAGPLTLLYPQWIPGDHQPVGPIADMVGLKISASGTTLAWARDPIDMYAFHLDVPQGDHQAAGEVGHTRTFCTIEAS